jgi:hypothetical protein
MTDPITVMMKKIQFKLDSLIQNEEEKKNLFSILFNFDIYKKISKKNPTNSNIFFSCTDFKSNVFLKNMYKNVKNFKLFLNDKLKLKFISEKYLYKEKNKITIYEFDTSNLDTSSIPSSSSSSIQPFPSNNVFYLLNELTNTLMGVDKELLNLVAEEKKMEEKLFSIKNEKVNLLHKQENLTRNIRELMNKKRPHSRVLKIYFKKFLYYKNTIQKII